MTILGMQGRARDTGMAGRSLRLDSAAMPDRSVAGLACRQGRVITDKQRPFTDWHESIASTAFSAGDSWVKSASVC